MPQDHYTLTYRAAEAGQMMDWIKAGQSGSLIGLRGSGKSNFLRFLLRENVRQHYLKQNYADFIFVLIDLLALAKQAEWTVYELILNRLLGQLRSLDAKKETVEEIASLHREVRNSRDPLTAQWAVEQGVDLLCRRSTQQIVLLFDEFDTVFQAIDPSLFRCLRAIHDAHEGQISYLIVVTGDLSRLRDDLTDVDHFHRLVSRNVCDLEPYNEADTRQMIDQLASRRSIELNEADTASLVQLSGGHAGLLKAIMSRIWNEPYQDSGLAQITPTLTNEPAVQAECRKVWDSLPEREQAALATLTGQTSVDSRVLQRLKGRGLVREGQPTPSFFSPLFADFIRRQAPPSTKSVMINPSSRKVQLEGQAIETLTELEFEMLHYLYEHRARVCTKDELIANVYRQQYDQMTGGVTDEALQALISRLRAKVEPNPSRPHYIVTVRGEGYKFIEP
jgi:DNA-binding winged helix-turn-helix (wHTH) protein